MQSFPSPKRAIGPPASFERTGAVVAGAFLLLPVLRRRSVWRCGAAAAGGILIYNGLSGKGSIRHLLSPQPVSLRNIRQSITIGRSAVELSEMWRTPDVLARVMQPFGKIEILGTDHIRWSLHILSKTLAVDCILAAEAPGELVHWKSIPGAAFSVDERMHFKAAPQGRGTEATLTYDVDLSNLPAGAALHGLTSFFESTAKLALSKVLHNFRSFAETGEIPTLERNPSARAHGTSNGDLI